MEARGLEAGLTGAAVDGSVESVAEATGAEATGLDLAGRFVAELVVDLGADALLVAPAAYSANGLPGNLSSPCS